MFAKGRIWLAYLIVFISSTCTMVVEMVAGRIMAPYIGVSLYTWTSIIGIVLAGMSLGNYLGGIIADRRASPRTLGLVFLAGSLSSAGILVMTNIAFNLQLQMPLIPKIVILTTAIFIVPSIVLGMVSPIVVKLALEDVKTAGGTVGSIYAFSTVGSIFVTFITGFVLISWIGTRSIIWLVVGTLLVMAVAVGGLYRPKARLATLSGTLLACGVALWANASGFFRWFPESLTASLPDLTAGALYLLTLAIVLVAAFAAPPVRRADDTVASASTSPFSAGGGGPGGLGLLAPLSVVALAFVFLGWNGGYYRAPCEVESDYFCIRLSETTADGHKVQALVLDHLIHSYVDPTNVKTLGYGYERVYDEVTRFHAASLILKDDKDGKPEDAVLDTLFIGGGGYTFPRYVEAQYPRSSIDVLEIDPAVTEFVYDRMGMSRDSRIRPFNQDARTFLMEWKDPKKIDVIYGDAFNDMSVPYHLTTVEFDQMLADRLKPDGIYMVNVIDKYQGGEFAKAFLVSLRQVFPNVYLLSQGEAWLGTRANTYILMASMKPFDYTAFREFAGPDSRTVMLPPEQLDKYLAEGREIVLNDDFAPVDQLVARLFVERGY